VFAFVGVRVVVSNSGGGVMKTYIGIGTDGRQAGPVRVYVQLNDEEFQPLLHRVRHSPDGFQWGYGGSGPADLARSILWDWLGYEPEPALYQAFKRDYVARWSMHTGESWRIASDEIMLWLLRFQAGVSGCVGDPIF
jgi:hypothetical protein